MVTGNRVAFFADLASAAAARISHDMRLKTGRGQTLGLSRHSCYRGADSGRRHFHNLSDLI